MPVSLEPPAEAGAPQPAPSAPPVGTRLPIHYARCYGCGPEHPTGLRMAVVRGEGPVAVAGEFVVTEDHQGAPGLAHGGVLATAMDESLGYLLFLLATPAVTARLEVDYRQPVPVGTRLRLECEAVATRGRKTWVRGRGLLPDGRVAVQAAALFLAVGLEHFTTHGTGWGQADGPRGQLGLAARAEERRAAEQGESAGQGGSAPETAPDPVRWNP